MAETPSPQTLPPASGASAIAAAPPLPGLFSTAERVQAPRSPASFWSAVGLHAVIIALIAFLIARHVTIAAPAHTSLTLSDVTVPPPPPVAPKADKMGGGGGQKGPTPVTQGHLPKFAQEQIVPPKAPPLEKPKLAVDPTVVMQPNLKMADNKLPDLGMPNSNLKGAFSAGNGNGSGLGSGNGSGIGPGSGGNTGGGPMHVGGAVRAPVPVYTPDPEFSDEARKAKFQGNVQVYLWVDQNGNTSHVRVVRGIGMGLDEKAVEAVKQYKFKPALVNGKPTLVDMYIDVNFQIF